LVESTGKQKKGSRRKAALGYPRRRWNPPELDGSGEQ
jgi:hypothetical protein